MSKNKIKVLQITGAMNRGGAEVMLMDIYRNISSDFHFDFLVNYKLNEGIRKGDFDNEIETLGGEVLHIGTQWDVGFLKYIKEFKKIIEGNGVPDIVHIHMNAKSGVIALAAKKAGVKNIIVHSHADLKFRGSLPYVLVSKLELQFQKYLISKYATNYWGCSQEANESLFYKKLLTPEKSSIIKNAVDVEVYQAVLNKDVDKLRESYKINEQTIVFGNVGRVVRHKNVDFIMDVLNDFQKEHIDFVFVFAGRDEQPEYLKEIFDKAEQYKLLDKIKYLGVRDDIPVVMNSFDVYIGPALQEGFGLVAVEAQAAGVPCVLYNGFPKSVDMGFGFVKFLNNFEVSNWTLAIKDLPRENPNFKDIKESITSKGFDSRSNTKRIENLYKLMT